MLQWTCGSQAFFSSRTLSTGKRTKRAIRKEYIRITKVTNQPVKHILCIHINIKLKFAGRALPAKKLLNVEFLCSVTYTEKPEPLYLFVFTNLSLNAFDPILPTVKRICSCKCKFIVIYELEIYYALIYYIMNIMTYKK